MITWKETDSASWGRIGDHKNADYVYVYQTKKLWYAGQEPILLNDMIPVSTCGADEFKARAEEHAGSLAAVEVPAAGL